MALVGGYEYMQEKTVKKFRINSLMVMKTVATVIALFGIIPSANAMHIMEGYLPPQYCIA